MSIRISALKMQLTLSAQVERTCNFKILSLRATVCVFSFWKVSILSERKTHIDKWRTCWFSGKLEMGETTYMKNFNQPIKTVNSISSGRQAATSSHGCLRQPEETYFGRLLLSQWAFSVNFKMSQLCTLSRNLLFCFHFSLVWENRNAATIWAILVILVSCIPIYGATRKIQSFTELLTKDYFFSVASKSSVEIVSIWWLLHTNPFLCWSVLKGGEICERSLFTFYYVPLQSSGLWGFPKTALPSFLTCLVPLCFLLLITARQPPSRLTSFLLHIWD